MFLQCRAVAAVLLGNPDNFVRVPVPTGPRFQQLNDRIVDLLIRGDTHTIEREVKEVRNADVAVLFIFPRVTSPQSNQSELLPYKEIY